ncbi:MAG: bifunctional NADP-dependent methylenetetrahydromethanopterin dehydrogenase/methylenetetrahydrofolate dehydrogenase, partial [Pirellulales bacterium]
LVIAAGAAGVQLLPADVWRAAESLRVAIDLNAVPPVGIEGIKPTDAGTAQGSVTCYGALGVGQAKMRIHKAAIRRLFESNDQVLDAEQILQIGRSLGG